ncbi:MAG: N-acetylmuramoyl-L-alanine amidase [Acidimicrobiia bacterium]
MVRFVPLLALLLVVGVGVALGAGLDEPAGVAVPSTTTAPPLPANAGVLVAPPGGLDLHAAPGGAVDVRAAGGLALPVLETDGTWARVLTQCSGEPWARLADAEVIPAADPGIPGAGFDLAGAVVVVDAGHGGKFWGAVGPTGLTEKEANLDIAVRLESLLSAPRDVDWDTGTITVGTTYPSVDRVLQTRRPDGPLDGDLETSLAYRAQLASSAGADVFVSIHNNSVPNGTRTSPGTEIFWSLAADGSDRLASLLHEEVVRSVAPFLDEWGGKSDAGVRARVDPETGEDFYGLLRRATVPSAIVEGTYISEAPEEALLRTAEFRQAYAEGVYRGLIRFLTTDDLGTDIREPEAWTGDPGRPRADNCELPTAP